MEVINGISYLTLEEVLLRLSFDTMKERLGSLDTDYWKRIFIRFGKRPPHLNDQELSSFFLKNTFSHINDFLFLKEEDLEALSTSELEFAVMLSDMIRLSDRDSLIHSALGKRYLPEPFDTSDSTSVTAARKNFIISLREDPALTHNDQVKYGHLLLAVMKIIVADEKKYKPDEQDENDLQFKGTFAILEGFSQEIQSIMDGLASILYEQLQTGKIIAIGYERPIKSSSVRKEILADHWQILEFKAGGDAEKEEYKFTKLLFRANHTNEPSVASSAPAKRGRASKMNVIAEEMKRRASAGELDLRGLKAECNKLREWCQTHHKQVYDAGSLEKKLGKLYRELVATHTKI